MLRHRNIATKRYCLTAGYADPQAVGHMRAGSADRDGLAASKSEARKRSRCVGPGHLFFDERSHECTTLGVESLGCLGKEGSTAVGHSTATFREINASVS